MQIITTFIWTSKCHHIQFDPHCIWCADLERRVREAQKSLTRYDLSSGYQPAEIQPLAKVNDNSSSTELNHES